MGVKNPPRQNKNMTYSSSTSINRSYHARTRQNGVSFQAQARTLGPVSNTIILIILACLIGFLYLTQVTKTNSYGYTINNLQQQQTELQDQQQNLEVTAARLQSLDRVEASQVAQKLVSVAPSDSIQN